MLNKFYLVMHPSYTKDHEDHEDREVRERRRATLLDRLQGITEGFVERTVCTLRSKATADIVVSELNKQYREGLIEGLTRYAWWKDGTGYVGTGSKTLKQAIADLDQ